MRGPGAPRGAPVAVTERTPDPPGTLKPPGAPAALTCHARSSPSAAGALHAVRSRGGKRAQEPRRRVAVLLPRVPTPAGGPPSALGVHVNTGGGVSGSLRCGHFLSRGKADYPRELSQGAGHGSGHTDQAPAHDPPVARVRLASSARCLTLPRGLAGPPNPLPPRKWPAEAAAARVVTHSRLTGQQQPQAE